jgi:hypothetical protein
MALQPVFSFSKMAMHSDVRLVPLEQYNDTFERDPLWADKPFDRAVWRGSTTGVWFDRTTRWRSSQRIRLYWLGRDAQGARRVRFPDVADDRHTHERTVRHEDLTRRYLDFAFSGEIWQCVEEDGRCASYLPS